MRALISAGAKYPDLASDGVRRHMQLLARLYHAARLGDPQEVIEMLETHRAKASIYAMCSVFQVQYT